ncbi:MAG: response regulator [Spirochaetes bacterium]|nr:response regulator [Spirochaetota bacterium]
MDNKPPSILVVDDIDVNVMILEEILAGDYRVFSATNGKEALEMLEKTDPAPKLILLDVVMPQMSGPQMFEIMKQKPAYSRIPVIFITAENDSESQLLAAGAVDFINKPFLPEIVKLRVKNQIKLKNYSDSLEEMVAEKTAEATRVLDSVLQGLASIIEHRNMESGEHVKRTQLYVKNLTDYLIESKSIYAEELIAARPDLIMKAMALHDVGKIAIPDSILLKPGKLDPEEYDIMKTHTVKGMEIIKELGDAESSLYLKHSEDICYGHHERWDGKGYPQMLKGTEIPLVARMAAIADVYDALVSARVYKPSMSFEETIKIMKEGAGTQFDPFLVEALIPIQEKFKEIALQYK